MTHRWIAHSVLATFAVSAACHGATPGTLQVNIDGLRSARGTVRCFLYNSEKGFPKNQDAAFASAIGAINGGKSRCEFTNVPDGNYAVSVYHDENNNQRLDSNFLGIPKEGVGASNDAKASMGPPKYQDALVAINEGRQSLTIHIHYL